MRLALALILVAAAPLSAQVPFNACFDRAGHLVPGVVRNDLGNYGGMATFEDGHPVIYWNQKSVETTSHAFQVYLYMHECAHILLRHIYHEESALAERQADCWALQLLFDGGMLDGYSAGVLEDELRRMPGDAVHDSGEVLLRRAALCRAARTDAKQWAPVLDTLAADAPDSFRALRGDRIQEITDRTVYEARLGAPGVFDCDLRGGVVYRCLLFAGRIQKGAERAYAKTLKILLKWLPDGWSHAEKDAPAGEVAREFDAQDGRSGTTFVLILTSTARVWFAATPGGP